MNKYGNNYYKKILLILVVFFCFSALFTTLNIFATSGQEGKKVAISAKITHINNKLDTRGFVHQTHFYKTLKSKISEKKIHNINAETLELISYIESSFDVKYAEYKRNHEKKLEEEKNKIKKHTTLILTFTKNGDHLKLITTNLKKIKHTGSVFLFKKGKDLTRNDINFITKELLKINKNLFIFIDQEGGWINRYVDFHDREAVEIFFSQGLHTADFLEERFLLLSDKEKKIIRNMFPKISGYFPSLEKIGKTYDVFSEIHSTCNKNPDCKNTVDKTDIYLEIVAFIRLQTLKDNGINTYGLVLDLNRGNPVISNYSRSFSKHKEKYKRLVDAFTLASQQTRITLYFKHFPGHGEGKIDSHKGILDLTGKEKYIQENIELFEYALNNNPGSGLMIGHMYIPETLKKDFLNSVNLSSFILTDDLGMKGYKLAKGKVKKDLFFTTDQIINSTILITVDSINVNGIK